MYQPFRSSTPRSRRNDEQGGSTFRAPRIYGGGALFATSPIYGRAVAFCTHLRFSLGTALAFTHTAVMPSSQPPSSRDPSRASVLSAFAAAVLADLTDEQLSVLAARLRPHLHADQAATGRLLSPAEAAARLGIHPKTLTRAARQGRVPGARRVGRCWRFDASQLALEPVAPASSIAPSPARPRRRAHGASSAVDAIRTGRSRDR